MSGRRLPLYARAPRAEERPLMPFPKATMYFEIVMALPLFISLQSFKLAF